MSMKTCHTCRHCVRRAGRDDRCAHPAIIAGLPRDPVDGVPYRSTCRELREHPCGITYPGAACCGPRGELHEPITSFWAQLADKLRGE